MKRLVETQAGAKRPKATLGLFSLSILLVFLMTLAIIPALTTTVRATVGGIDKGLCPAEGDLGDTVHVTLQVIVPDEQVVTVVDTLPPEFTYISGTFMVKGVPATPTVGKTPPPPPRSQVLSYSITTSGDNTIEFDIKVTEAYWEDREVCNVATATWYDGAGIVIEEKEATGCFVIHAFEELHKNVGIPKADVVFSFDLTGSMSPHIAGATSQAATIINNLQILIADVAFGVVTHVDYPYSYTDYCGYTGQYGDLDADLDGIGDVYGDYAYKTDLDITEDAALATSTIAGLGTYWGADGPQNYTRVLYETQFLSWRDNAKKIVVLFGDNIPHDCDFWTYSTGGDPGPDATANTADDLDFQAVVAELASQGITVMAVDCSSEPEGWAAAFYQYLAGETGGQYFMLGETGIPEAIKQTVKAEALETLTIKEKTEIQWAVVIDVTNPFEYTMEDIVITDRFGAEIEIDELFPYSITHGTAQWDYGPGEGKKKPNWKSKKLFLTWEIGDLAPEETARLILLVSTDLNPAGHQEYTSPGIYELNSGATLKFIDPEQDMQLSAVTDSIYVTVLPTEDP